MTDRDFESVGDLWTIRNENQIRQFARSLTRDELLETVVFLTDALRIEKKKTELLTPPAPTFTSHTPCENQSSQL